MNEAAERGLSVADSIKPRSTESLRYGLRELAPLRSPRVFCGKLTMAGERCRLELAEEACVLDVYSSSLVDRRLHEQRVSILGCLREQTLAAESPGEAIIAMKIVSHEAVARRAYEIHESCPDGGAVENWLCAQRELLEH